MSLWSHSPEKPVGKLAHVLSLTSEGVFVLRTENACGCIRFCSLSDKISFMRIIIGNRTRYAVDIDTRRCSSNIHPIRTLIISWD